MEILSQFQLTEVKDYNPGPIARIIISVTCTNYQATLISIKGALVISLASTMSVSLKSKLDRAGWEMTEATSGLALNWSNASLLLKR